MEASSFRNIEGNPPKINSTLPKMITQWVPSDEDFEWLSYQVTDWIALARILRIKARAIKEIEETDKNIFEKTYRMLQQWKEMNGSAAIYPVLRDALRHPLVGRKDLADKLGGSTKHLPRPKVKSRNEDSPRSDASTSDKE